MIYELLILLSDELKKVQSFQIFYILYFEMSEEKTLHKIDTAVHQLDFDTNISNFP